MDKWLKRITKNNSVRSRSNSSAEEPSRQHSANSANNANGEGTSRSNVEPSGLVGASVTSANYNDSGGISNVEFPSSFTSVVSSQDSGSLQSREEETPQSRSQSRCSDASFSDLDEEKKGEQETGRQKRQKKKTCAGKFSTKWLAVPEFTEWLVKSTSQNKSNEQAFCKVCNVNIYAHKNVIRRHMLSSRHIHQMQIVSSNNTILGMQVIVGDNSVKRAEMKLCGLLASNNLSFKLMDTLGPLCANIFPDSKIAKGMSVKRTKATSIMNAALGDKFSQGLYRTLSDKGRFFSIIMDESTDKASIKQCAFTVIFICPILGKVVTKFFDIVETSQTNAEELYKCLKNCILSKKIPLNNLIGFSSDTTNVMFGEYNSVYTHLKTDLPYIVCQKCSCHMIHLSAAKACLLLPRSVEDLLRNIGSHFSRSFTRQESLKEFQNFFKVDIHKILLPANTRWLSLKACIDRVLEQYDVLKAYLTEHLYSDPSKTTESMLAAMSNKFTKVYLYFMSYALEMLTDFNKLFQSESPLLYKLKPELENLIKSLSCNFLKFDIVKNNDPFKLNHKNPEHFVSLTDIYLGVQAAELFAEIQSECSPPESEMFLKNCLSFYIELLSDIKKRFTFDDELFTFIEIVDPAKAQSFEVKSLASVIRRFPFLKNFVNAQSLDNEWRKHATLNYQELDLHATYPDEYWHKVFELKNAAGENLFPNLSIVINLLLILPFSNASVERIFSHMNDIKTDVRNCLCTENLCAILHTKQGIKDAGGLLSFEPTSEMLSTKIWKTEKKTTNNN